MTDFVTVAIVLVVFLFFGIAMGVLGVSALSRRRRSRYLEGGGEPRPPFEPLPEDDEKPPWYRR